MRVPSSEGDLLRWWSNAMLGALAEDLPFELDQPQCGWFQRRLVKGGPFVPARIYVEQEVDEDTGDLVSDETLHCEVNGREVDAEQEWERLRGSPISQADYDYLKATGEWSRAHAPNEPAANPRKAVDWMKTPVPKFSKGLTQ